jgi:hypothetical protein
VLSQRAKSFIPSTKPFIPSAKPFVLTLKHVFPLFSPETSEISKFITLPILSELSH